ncbi:hypothetical protein [Longimicrobium sp.]|uniref:hypothetical protein n=1 Tax=Longimicrobium sp. TaxID=2029185 RepID=UPI003B3BC33B
MMRMIPRCAAGLLLAACAVPRPVVPPPAPEPPVRTVETCAVSAGQLRKVQVEVSATTGDTTFQGRPFASAFPLTAEYATGAAWYERNEPLPETVRPRENERGDYVKYGRPRVLSADTLMRVSTHHGVGVYMTHEDAWINEGIVWVPVRPGCWFQHYQFSGVGEVREG